MPSSNLDPLLGGIINRRITGSSGCHPGRIFFPRPNWHPHKRHHMDVGAIEYEKVVFLLHLQPASHPRTSRQSKMPPFPFYAQKKLKRQASLRSPPWRSRELVSLVLGSQCTHYIMPHDTQNQCVQEMLKNSNIQKCYVTWACGITFFPPTQMHLLVYRNTQGLVSLLSKCRAKRQSSMSPSHSGRLHGYTDFKIHNKSSCMTRNLLEQRETLTCLPSAPQWSNRMLSKALF